MTKLKCKICESPLLPFEKDIFDDRHGYPGKFDIYRCESCGFGQTIPEIPEDRISEIYTRYYPRRTIQVEDMKNSPAYVKPSVVRWWFGIDNTAHYHVKKGTKVLDIGCGDCTSIREINAMGAEGYGIEPDQNIKPVVDAFGLNVHIGLFNDINFPGQHFDYITMSQVMEHMHHPIQFLSGLKKILKHNGQVIMGFPNIDARLRSKYRSRWLNWHVPYHINHFSRNSIFKLAEQAGYRVKTVRTITPNLWVDWQVKLYNYPVGEGVRVPFLNGESEPAPSNSHKAKAPGKLSTVINKIKGRIERLTKHLYIGRIIQLRIFDALGKGESYLVFLEKK